MGTLPSILVILRIAIPLFYLVVSTGFIINSLKKKPAATRGLLPVLLAGIIAHAACIVILLVSNGGIPLKTGFEGGAFSGLAFMVIASVIVFFQKEGNFGAFLFPLGFLISTFSMVFLDKGVPLPPAFASQLYGAHTWIIFGAYSCFLLSAVSSIMYLLQHHEIRSRSLGGLYERLPSLETMDRLVFRADATGVALLIIGIVMGFLWLGSPGIKPSNLNIKIAFSMLTAMTYVCEHILRMGRGWEGKRASIVSITGFALVMATFLAGHHGL